MPWPCALAIATVCYLLAAAPSAAQVRRLNVPTSAVPAARTTQVATTETTEPVASSPAGAWHFGIGLGSIAYGSTSVCECSSFSLDVAAGYESARGSGLEYQVALTQTTRELIDQRVNLFFYPRLGRLGRGVGVYAGGGVVTQLNGGITRGRGYAYGYGVRARAPLGGRGRTRVFADVGVSTARERLEFDEAWIGNDLTRRQVHSGLRVRVGVVW